MRRREFIAGVCATTAARCIAWPLAARAQQSGLPLVGFLHRQSPDLYSPMVAAFRNGLKESGYVEGQNIAVEYRWAENESNRLTTMALDLVRRAVNVICAAGGPSAALVAKAS